MVSAAPFLYSRRLGQGAGNRAGRSDGRTLMCYLDIRAYLHNVLEDKPLGLRVFLVLAFVASATAMILAAGQDTVLQQLLF